MEDSSLKEVEKNYEKGSEYLQTSCIKCRFKPEYEDAIPYLKQSADGFHGYKKYSEEIDARNKLIKCFNSTKSYWEEGHEYEKLFKLHMDQLKSPEEALNYVINSKNAYISNKTYNYAIKALSKAGKSYMESGDLKNAEKVYKNAYESIDKYYHVLTLDKDEDFSYIYECVDNYLDILFEIKKYSNVCDVSKGIIKLMKDNDQKDNYKISKYYGFQAIAHIINKDEEAFSNAMQKGMEICEGRNSPCTPIDKIYGFLKQPSLDEKDLKNVRFNITDLSAIYPSKVTKNLNALILEKKNNCKVIDSKEPINKNKSLSTISDYPEDYK